MNHTIYFDSPEGERMRRDRRIHVMPSVRGATAVRVVFAGNCKVVERGKLSASVAEARRLVHQLMAQFDSDNPVIEHERHATIQPITAQELRAMRSSGVDVLDPAQLQADYDLIVQTCYEAIRNSGESEVRMQAAHILHSVGFIPGRVS